MAAGHPASEATREGSWEGEEVMAGVPWGAQEVMGCQGGRRCRKGALSVETQGTMHARWGEGGAVVEEWSCCYEAPQCRG